MSIYQLIHGHLHPITENIQDRDDLLYKNRVAVLPSYKQNNELNRGLKIYKVLSIPDNEYKLSRLLKEHSYVPAESKVNYNVLKTDDQDVEDSYDANKKYKDLTLDASVEQLPILRAVQKRYQKWVSKGKRQPPQTNKYENGHIQPLKNPTRNSKNNVKPKQLRSNVDDTLEPDVPHVHMYNLLNDGNYQDREQSDEHVSLQELPSVIQDLLNDGPSDVQDKNDDEGLKQRLKSQRGLYMLSQINDGKELLDNNLSKGAAYQLLSLLGKNDGKPLSVKNKNGLYVKTYRIAQDKGADDDLPNTLNQENKKVILLPIKSIMNTESKKKNDPRHWASHFDTADSSEKEGKDLIHFIDSTNDAEAKYHHNFDDMTRLDEHAKVLHLLAKKGVLPKS